MRKRRKLIRTILYGFALILFVFSASKVLDYVRETLSSSNYNDNLIDQVVSTTSSKSTGEDKSNNLMTGEATEKPAEANKAEAVVPEETPEPTRVQADVLKATQKPAGQATQKPAKEEHPRSEATKKPAEANKVEAVVPEETPELAATDEPFGFKPLPVVYEDAPISVDFEALLKENADVVGWLYSEKTPISYPVMQAADNEYYLDRLLNGKKNITGSLFMDCRNNLLNLDWNTVIYGHNMKSGSMFGTLSSYRKQDYYDRHPVMYFLTPTVNYKIELISGFVAPADAELYNTYLFTEDMPRVLTDIRNASDFVSRFELAEGDRLFTLSTCSYEFDSARYVVIGRMLEMRSPNLQE